MTTTRLEADALTLGYADTDVVRELDLRVPTGQVTVIVGALIVLVADHAGAYAFADLNLPVGVVTGACGAPFLLWLLARGRAPRRAA